MGRYGTSQAPWGSNPLPFSSYPGIQGEAFSFGMQSGLGIPGSVWDVSIWDEAEWSFDVSHQLPWIFSGLSGSFSQLGKR